MKQVASGKKKKSKAQERLAVLRLELDYELAVLYEAIQEKNEKQMKKCKQKLHELRNEFIQLKEYTS
ncbi:hypothetical protein J2S13_001192 [Oikeobacillus pervagus]|uniref:Uncharacterized protein n=1 Tax=Oikeobacillus pervagus TaxID=1325931 RepID=A0AAJ1SXX3_9BACI|nr:hypothetical protein [Oikeobacillus pervagus]MDQ0214795.1 hypothetical protein [Oikeobacillus pervagus]